MKKIKSFLICGFVLAFTSLATIANADSATHETKATCRALHGDVKVSYDNGATWEKIRPNTEVRQGAMIKSGADSSADFQVNGRTSTVRVTASTTMTLKTMEAMGEDSQTLLDVNGGLVMGSVKKISADSNYHVETPHGVAGIRGTDFAVQVVDNGNGTFNVTFTSKTGEIVCMANVNIAGTPQTITKTLSDGQSWVVPNNAPDAQTAALTSVLQDILSLNWNTLVITVTTEPNATPVVTHVPSTPAPVDNGGTGYNGGTGG